MVFYWALRSSRIYSTYARYTTLDLLALNLLTLDLLVLNPLVLNPLVLLDACPDLLALRETCSNLLDQVYWNLFKLLKFIQPA